MAKIKICGLRREEDIRYVNRLMPDYVGMILSGGFRRSLDTDTARRLRSKLNDGIQTVGVFVDAPIEALNLDFIDLVQLHGSESPAYCSKIKLPVIKVLKPADFDKVRDYAPFVDYFMFDSGTGTGQTFDWTLLPKTEKPFFLAGGLGRDNLAEAINTVHPFAVDMSSSVETDGVKDYDKIKQVIEITRGAK